MYKKFTWISYVDLGTLRNFLMYIQIFQKNHQKVKKKYSGPTTSTETSKTGVSELDSNSYRKLIPCNLTSSADSFSVKININLFSWEK